MTAVQGRASQPTPRPPDGASGEVWAPPGPGRQNRRAAGPWPHLEGLVGCSLRAVARAHKGLAPGPGAQRGRPGAAGTARPADAPSTLAASRGGRVPSPAGSPADQKGLGRGLQMEGPAGRGGTRAHGPSWAGRERLLGDAQPPTALARAPRPCVLSLGPRWESLPDRPHCRQGPSSRPDTGAHGTLSTPILTPSSTFLGTQPRPRQQQDPPPGSRPTPAQDFPPWTLQGLTLQGHPAAAPSRQAEKPSPPSRTGGCCWGTLRRSSQPPALQAYRAACPSPSAPAPVDPSAHPGLLPPTHALASGSGALHPGREKGHGCPAPGRGASASRPPVLTGRHRCPLPRPQLPPSAPRLGKMPRMSPEPRRRNHMQ